jgi:polysaccharide chain length determinant protein (PEP-CTERM system associated)
MSKDGKPVPGQDSEEFEPDLGDMIRGLLQTMRRRKWFILLPLAVVTAGAGAFSMRLPNKYISEATVGVVQQAVSERYVASDAMPINEAVTALRQEILSRPSLLRIIEEMNLYGDRSEFSPEELAERFQSDLTVDAVEARRDEITSLRIAFTSQDPKVAQRVASRVTAAFIQENAKQQEVRVTSNNTFLDEQVSQARAKLDQIEARMQSYKTRNIDQLPEQQSSNAIALADLRSRVRGIGPEIERIRRSLRTVEGSVSDKLTRLQADRAELIKKYAPQHQNIIKKDTEIALYSALRELFSPEGPSARARQVLAGDEDAQVTQLRNQAEDYSSDIEKLKADEADLNTQILDYKNRVSAAPLHEQEQASVLRDYNALKESYEALRASQLKAGLTTNLDQLPGSGRFRLIEPPTLPLRPSGPKRLRLAVGGAAGGLLVGLVLAFLAGSVDRTFTSEKEVANAFSVPLVLGIPEILTPKEQSRRTWKRAFDWAAGSALILLVISTEVFVFLKG